MQRSNERANDVLREVNIELDYLDNPDGSCLFSIGNTKVICVASVQEIVPSFLKNQGTGWITAEYEMLPHACKERSMRESSAGKRKGRSHEIQRIIGRTLRSVVNLDKIGERSIWIDCDVIQADGGTRTAGITGGFIALYQALEKLVNKGELKELPVKNFVAAVSVGIVRGEVFLDLEYSEDSIASVDMNLAMTDDNKLIEIQGTAEGKPFDKEKLYNMVDLGCKGISQLIKEQKKVLKK